MHSHSDTTDTDAMTYAIGDIHGEVTLLRQLMQLLPLRPQDRLVFLGDYMNRGEDSVATIRELSKIQREHEKSIFLRGNHDETWLEQWDGQHFIEPPLMPGALAVWHAWNGKVPADVGEWLSTTRIDYEDEYAYYVHAGALPGTPFYDTPREIKLWGESIFLRKDYNWGKPVVFGHWQLEKPMITKHKIGVDTWANKTGVLTAVRLPDLQIFQTPPRA